MAISTTAMCPVARSDGHDSPLLPALAVQQEMLEAVGPFYHLLFPSSIIVWLGRILTGYQTNGGQEKVRQTSSKDGECHSHMSVSVHFS